ncbi:MAG: response regulator transcription factor [Patescibacteria group bacterium]|jgi:DNA-binding response OmpR family regulator
MKILLIEDDQDISQSLSLSLKSSGYIIESVADGERGCFLAQTNEYSLILMDYNLPKMNGREITEKLRKEKINTPIIILSVRGEISDKVDLLTIGADDYLAKPFSFPELLARIKAILRRPEDWQGNILKFKDIELDPDKFLVTKSKQRIAMSTKEFSLLEYLLINKGRISSRQEIMESVWDANADPFSNTIEVHIKNLRRKLETDGQKIIFTISNRGYKIDEQR